MWLHLGLWSNVVLFPCLAASVEKKGGKEERGPLLSAWMRFTGAICYMLEIRCLLVASQESQDSASLYKSRSCFFWSSPVLFLFLWWSSTRFNFRWVAVFGSGILFPAFTPVHGDLPQPRSLNRLVVCPHAFWWQSALSQEQEAAWSQLKQQCFNGTATVWWVHSLLMCTNNTCFECVPSLPAT